jgi:hypothetical protein
VLGKTLLEVVKFRSKIESIRRESLDGKEEFFSKTCVVKWKKKEEEEEKKIRSIRTTSSTTP